METNEYVNIAMPLVTMIATKGEAIDAAKANTASASALLARLAFKAASEKKAEEVGETLREKVSKDWWKRVKGTWSAACTFHDFLAAGGSFGQDAKAESPWIIGGTEATTVDQTSIAAIASATDGKPETTVPALVKRFNAVRKERKERAEAKKAADTETLAAFLRCPEAKEWKGEDASSLPYVMNDQQIAEAKRIGAKRLEAEAAEAAEAAQWENYLAAVNRLNESQLNELALCIAARRTAIAAKAAEAAKEREAEETANNAAEPQPLRKAS